MRPKVGRGLWRPGLSMCNRTLLCCGGRRRHCRRCCGRDCAQLLLPSLLLQLLQPRFPARLLACLCSDALPPTHHPYIQVIDLSNETVELMRKAMNTWREIKPWLDTDEVAALAAQVRGAGRGRAAPGGCAGVAVPAAAAPAVPCRCRTAASCVPLLRPCRRPNLCPFSPPSPPPHHHPHPGGQLHCLAGRQAGGAGQAVGAPGPRAAQRRRHRQAGRAAKGAQQRCHSASLLCCGPHRGGAVRGRGCGGLRGGHRRRQPGVVPPLLLRPRGQQLQLLWRHVATRPGQL